MGRKNAKLWRLSREIWDRIVESVEDYPVGTEEVEAIRQEFMAERAEYQKQQTEAMMNHGQWDLDWEDDERVLRVC